jgi:hypothetical protein
MSKRVQINVYATPELRGMVEKLQEKYHLKINGVIVVAVEAMYERAFGSTAGTNGVVNYPVTYPYPEQSE